MIRTGIIILVLAVIAFLSWRFKQSEILETTTATVEPAHQSDFFLEDFRTRQYGETGRLRYRFNGQRLEHFPADDSTLINQPSMILHDDTGPSWRITAVTGEAGSEELDEIRLTGHVEITRDTAGGNPPVQITTASLLLKPKMEFVQSEDMITLTQPGVQLVAQSLEARLEQGQFKLHNVQGRYEP